MHQSPQTNALKSNRNYNDPRKRKSVVDKTQKLLRIFSSDQQRIGINFNVTCKHYVRTRQMRKPSIFAQWEIDVSEKNNSFTENSHRIDAR